jgi:hypothetical protein
VIPIPIEPLLTPAPLENQEQQAAAPEPQEPQENPEPTATAPEPQEEGEIVEEEVEEPVVQVEELTQQSFFNSPPLIQSHSTNHLNSTQIPHSNEPRRMLQVSAIQSPLAPRSPVHLVAAEEWEPVEVESSDDDVVFVAAVAAPVRPPRERRREERGRGRALRPRVVSTNDDDEFFVEKVVGWKVERGREYFSIKWAGYSEDFNTWEDGLEKRREIPEMVADYFTESGFDDEVSNFDDVNDRTYVNKRKRRRLM